MGVGELRNIARRRGWASSGCLRGGLASALASPCCPDACRLGRVVRVVVVQSAALHRHSSPPAPSRGCGRVGYGVVHRLERFERLLRGRRARSCRRGARRRRVPHRSSPAGLGHGRSPTWARLGASGKKHKSRLLK